MIMGKKVTRQQFIKTASISTAGVALGAAALTSKSYARILGANDRINFGVIGLHGRGGKHIESLGRVDNAMVTHLCDVDQREFAKRSYRVQELFGQKPVEEKTSVRCSNQKRSMR